MNHTVYQQLRNSSSQWQKKTWEMCHLGISSKNVTPKAQGSDVRFFTNFVVGKKLNPLSAYEDLEDNLR